MRNLLLIAAFFLGAQLFFAANGDYQPLNVKTGLWETTWTSSVTGRPPIPADMLEKMTPEQRAQFEAAMSSMMSQAQKPRTSKSCLTKDKLEKDPFKREDKGCTETVLASTGSKMDVRETCTHENAKSDVTVHIEAEDSEHVRGTVKSNVSASGNAMNVNGTFTSKWLGMVCGDTK
jgi:tRNA threonylcarbamoyladenosine modification (KEOPS) complex  Pcc1 subunit